MELSYIKSMLENGKYKELKESFETFDKRNQSINEWQYEWGLPLELHSCNIAHRLRNNLQSFLHNYFGIRHLDGATYKATAKAMIPEILSQIEWIEQNAKMLRSNYKVIKQFLYT